MRQIGVRRDDGGVASSIGTMLAILVVLALITMVTTGWAPEWTKAKESEHMRVVEGQVAALKALCDQVSLADNTDTVVSTPLTLGSEGVPLFSSDATGEVSLLSSSSNGYNTFSIVNSTGRYARVAYGSIVYSSTNTEYIDQTYIYEGGAIIVMQERGELMTTGPSLIIQNLTDGIHVSATLISLYSDGTSYEGAGTVGVQVRLVNEKITTTSNWSPGEDVWINVTGRAYTAWYDFFQRSVGDWGLGATAYDLWKDDATSTVHLELRDVCELTTDYVILGVSLDIT